MGIIEKLKELFKGKKDINDIQTTFNTDDIDELGGEIVEGDEPEVDDTPDVDEEEE